MSRAHILVKCNFSHSGAMVGVTCATEGAAGVVATLGLVRNLSRGAVKVQVGGYPTGLDGHQVSSDTYNVIVHKSGKYILRVQGQNLNQT